MVNLVTLGRFKLFAPDETSPHDSTKSWFETLRLARTSPSLRGKLEAMHPSKEELSGFLLGKLPAAATDAVAHHIEQCPPCQETLVNLESDQDTLLRKLRQSASPDPLPKPTGDDSPTSSFVRPAPSSKPAAPQPTREQFIHNLGASGLIDEVEWNRLQNEVPAIATAADGAALVRALVEHGTLTKFQAAAIYQGTPQGLIFGEYVVLDLLGSGGMGQVFKARHRSMDRIVALKVLTKAAVDSPEAVKRFQREVKAAAKLHHPNIVLAHDASRHDGVHFLVMEYVEGSDLSAVVKRDGPLSVERAVSYIAQAARGLAFAHAEGVVHRDIKPANLLLDKKGVVKILDMGLARLDGDVASHAAGEGLTQTGQVMGTVDYMAPEQAFDTSRADAKADVYGLGCTLYRLLTGRSLFTGDTLMQKLLAHREQPIPSLGTVRPEVPAALEALYRRMVAKQPEDRPTAAEVVAELEAIAAAELKPSGRDSGKKPPQRKLLAAGAAGFLLLCLGLWVIIRDKDGNEVGRMQVPPGGRTTISEEHIQPTDSTVPHNAKSTTKAASQILATNVDIVFLGNPIVVQWPVIGQSAWQRLASKWRIESLGNPIGNINALGRDLDEVRLRGWTPRAFVVSVGGTNKDHLADQWDGPADKYRDIIRRIGVNYPNAAIIVLSLIVDPAAPETSKVTAFHRSLNRAVRTFADDRRVQVIDPNEVLFNSDGSLRPGLTTAPGIAPTALGYEKLTDAIEPVLAKLVKSSAPTMPSPAARKTIDVLLLGGRPILNWKAAGLTAWQNRFSSLDTLNWADGGRTVGGITKDADRIEAEQVEPRVVVIYVNGNREGDLRRNYAEGIAAIRQVAPQAKIVMVSTILPFTPDGEEAVRSWNDAVHALADGVHTFYFELGPILLDDQGNRRPDRLIGWDITVAGYEAWAEAMEPLLAKLLTTGGSSADATLSQIDVVFLGNAFVQHWSDTGRSSWSDLSNGRRVINRGMAHHNGEVLVNDVIQLAREGVKPRVTVVQALGALPPNSIDKTIGEYRKLLQQLRNSFPTTFHILTSPIFPSFKALDSNALSVHQECNRRLAALAQEFEVHYVDLDTVFVMTDPRRNEWVNGPTLTALGYGRWAEAMQPLLTTDAGQAAKTSLAARAALAFSGDGHVYIASLKGERNPPFCLEAWIRPKQNPEGKNAGKVFDFAFPGKTDYFSVGLVQSAKATDGGAWRVGGAVVSKVTQTGPNSVGWNKLSHVAASFGTNACRVFIDGKLIHEQPITGTALFDSDASLRLGSSLHGEFIAMRFSRTPRYEQDFTPPKELAADADTTLLYRFDEGSGEILHDASGRGNNGKIIRGKWVVIDDPFRNVTIPSAGLPPPPAVAPFNSDEARAHQLAWAEYLGVRAECENSIGMKFMLIPPGEFLMGSSDEQIDEILKMSLGLASPETEKKGVEDERPGHQVKITKPFYLGKTEVTNGDFSRFVEATKFKTQAELDGGGKLYDPATRLSKTDPATNWRNPGYPFDAALPVTQVTFNDSIAFCNWLSGEEKLAPAYSPDAKQRSSIATANGYRLPTEAQWEHACRAGTTTIWYTGDQPTEVAAHRTSGKLQPVGLKLPNPFGLHDLYGSVHELCDDHSLEPFPSTLRIDPRGSRVESRAVRGGHFMNSPIHCRSAHRHAVGISSRDRTFGFRIVRELPLPATSDLGDAPKAKPNPSAADATKAAPPR